MTFTGAYPTQGRTGFSLWSVQEIEDFRAATDIFDAVIAGDARNVNLTGAGRPERVRAAVITPNAFAMLGVPALVGRTLDERDAVAGADGLAGGLAGAVVGAFALPWIVSLIPYGYVQPPRRHARLWPAQSAIS